MQQSTPEIERRLAALGKRSETMFILLEMVSRQDELQRQELQELRSAIVSSGGPEQRNQVAPGDISADMLG